MTDQDKIQHLTAQLEAQINIASATQVELDGADKVIATFRAENQTLAAQLAAARDALLHCCGISSIPQDDGRFITGPEFGRAVKIAREALANPSPAADALLQDRERLEKIIAILDSMPVHLYGADNANYSVASITLGQWTELREAIGYRQAKASTKEEA